jgi:phosphatidylglycerophosphatase A
MVDYAHMTGKSLYYRIATLGGTGRFPIAPGTAATIVVGFPIIFLLGLFPWWTVLLAAAFVTVLGCVASTAAEREIGTRDPGEIVIDELAGFLVAVIGYPVALKPVLLGFLFFRIYDIWKPWPLRLLQDRLNGGTAVMADDIGAGIYANISVWIVLGFWR